MKVNHARIPSIPIRVITNLVMYIKGAAGPSEVRQAITIMKETDPPAAEWLAKFVQAMEVSIDTGLKGRT